MQSVRVKINFCDKKLLRLANQIEIRNGSARLLAKGECKIGVSGRTKNVVSAGSFLIELGVYALFVFAYFFLVLHFLGNWLKHLFDDKRVIYAIVALTLIIVQGVFLEMLTSTLLRVIRRITGWGKA